MTTRIITFMVLSVPAFGWAAEVPTPAAAAVAKDRYDGQIADLQKQYADAVAEAATAYADASPRLMAKAKDAIDNAIAKAKAAGDLDKVLELQTEKDQLTKGVKVTPGIAAARQELDAAMQKARIAYDGKARDAHTKLLGELDQLEKAETMADRIKSALAMRAYRQQMEGVIPPLPWSKPFGWRFGKDKALLVQTGASPASEAAVERGLRWLQKVQKPNGSWDLNTGIALLPYLAAGYTHKGDGKYAKTIANGLQVLISSQKSTGGGRIIIGREMYDAVSAIALCEAFGMTNDPALKAPAQNAVSLIIKSQNSDGGWGSARSDSWATGWQVQALRSAQLAGLSVPKEVISKASEFLDRARVESAEDKTFTAARLLCHQYLDWDPKNLKLTAGIKEVKNAPPREDKTDARTRMDISYYYHATQVIRFVGGPDWHENWNPKMRDWLIDLQVRGNPQYEGSWHGPRGENGHVHSTCLALLTLEVYYRYPPLETRKEEP
jgi:hypothetical protein